MADTELKVIVKAKELMKHTYTLTSNANRYPKKFRHSLVDRMQIISMDIYELLLEANRINNKTENHISHGNCYRLGKTMDGKINEILRERSE